MMKAVISRTSLAVISRTEMAVGRIINFAEGLDHQTDKRSKAKVNKNFKTTIFSRMRRHSEIRTIPTIQNKTV